MSIAAEISALCCASCCLAACAASSSAVSCLVLPAALSDEVARYEIASVNAQTATPTPVEISKDLMATFRVVAPMVAPVNAACITLVTAVKPTTDALKPMQTAFTAFVVMPKLAITIVAPFMLLPNEIMEFTIVNACAANVILGNHLETNSPICTLMAANCISACFSCPASVLPSWAFMCPTLSVIICANMAARCCSVPYFIMFSWASLNVIPTRLNADVCPVMALPMRFATLLASSCVAFKPFCCAKRSFMAGISCSNVPFSFKKVAICCAPVFCIVPPITPNLDCAPITSLTFLMSSSVASIR